jgi:3-methyladenine DNA glycosylase AlkC
MPEPFKNRIDARLVREAARHLGRAWPAFDRGRFERLATDGLDALELKARAMHVADALEATLPADFGRAATVIEASLGTPLPLEGETGPPPEVTADDGIRGWFCWPLGEFVARRGLDHPARALPTLHALTQCWSAEWAIRPFIVRHPQETFATLARWTRDPSAHVRRLVSEGSRPRLPWGMQLKALIADPSPTLPLLEALLDDPSPYVRRSVANHLNDIAKDHPDVVERWLAAHLPGASPQRLALLRHASRTLVKHGHAGVMAHWGVGKPLRGRASLSLSPSQVTLGGSLELRAELTSTARRPQPLEIDVVVHHVKADGRRTPKVFKGWTIELGAGETRTLRKRHPLRAVTVRRYHAGRHRVVLRVNGRDLAHADFDLRLPVDA